MNIARHRRLLSIPRYVFQWIIICLPLSIVVGSLVALFLWVLDKATAYRIQHPWLLFLLPVTGVAIYFLYRVWGRDAEGGNDLVIEEIHQPGGGVPARMTPLVLITTVLTHFNGGSAGREGTAVQMGGSMAHLLGKWFKLSAADMKVILMAGIAAGFGAVFGTPLAGAIFALEVLAIGAMRYGAILPCLLAATLADRVTAAWGIRHTHYTVSTALSPVWQQQAVLMVEVVIAGVAFGLVARLFSGVSHTIKESGKAWIKPKWAIPVVGGVFIIALRYVAGTTDYLGLGVTGQYSNSVSIVNAFHAGGADTWSWLWKLLFTAVTLGLGFKGGEVTPLFFIGATLGNTIAVLCGAPIDLFAAIGFIGVFAGATNTPVACTIMGAELFGAGHTLYFAVACFVAYYCSGHTGIYHAQRIARPKNLRDVTAGETLRSIRQKRLGRNREELQKMQDRFRR